MKPALRILVPVALAASLVLVPAACGGDAVDISLAELAQSQEEFSGEAVVTVGRIKRFEGSSGAYYVLEDREQNRVALTPARRAAAFEGDRVSVSGIFEFKEGFGRVIDIETIRHSQ